MKYDLAAILEAMDPLIRGEQGWLVTQLRERFDGEALGRMIGEADQAGMRPTSFVSGVVVGLAMAEEVRRDG